MVNTCEHNCARAFSGLLKEDALNETQTFFTSQPIEVEARPVVMTISITVSINRRWQGLRLGYKNYFPFFADALE
jgi:hypothetical protein